MPLLLYAAGRSSEHNTVGQQSEEDRGVEWLPFGRAPAHSDAAELPARSGASGSGEAGALLRHTSSSHPNSSATDDLPLQPHSSIVVREVNSGVSSSVGSKSVSDMQPSSLWTLEPYPGVLFTLQAPASGTGLPQVIRVSHYVPSRMYWSLSSHLKKVDTLKMKLTLCPYMLVFVMRRGCTCRNWGEVGSTACLCQNSCPIAILLSHLLWNFAKIVKIPVPHLHCAGEISQAEIPK